MATLNLRQEKFCQLYSTEVEFFGNGTQSYIEAYDIDVDKKGAYNAARANASELLTKANILERINELLELAALNDTFVDKQLSFVITQNADFGSKMAAIREYNKLKARITDKTETEITHKFEDLSDEELEQAIQTREARLS